MSNISIDTLIIVGMKFKFEKMGISKYSSTVNRIYDRATDLKLSFAYFSVLPSFILI